MSKIGKDQSYSREINNLEIMKKLMEKPYSATELADELSLSNATISSILNNLLKQDVLKVNEVSSVNHYGRKRVFYVINPDFGMTLCVNISNLHARISLVDMQNKILVSEDTPVKKYDANAVYRIILESSRLVLKIGKIPLKYIILSLPGRVNSNTGELLLSKQFDKELFQEKHFLQSTFSKQFGNIPVLLVNDIKLKALAELNQGCLKETKNAFYLSVDYGIGGALVIQHELFLGDNGYAGEFGLLKYYDGKREDYLDNFISLRILILEAEKITGKEVKRDDLPILFQTNEQFHKLVLESASILGKAITPLFDTFDISTIVLGGRIASFGEEYLSKVQEENNNLVNEPKIMFSKIDEDAEVYGAAQLGIKMILKGVAQGESHE